MKKTVGIKPAGGIVAGVAFNVGDAAGVTFNGGIVADVGVDVGDVAAVTFKSRKAQSLDR